MYPFYRSTVHSARLYFLARPVPSLPPALRRRQRHLMWWAESWEDARQQWQTWQKTSTDSPRRPSKIGPIWRSP